MAVAASPTVDLQFVRDFDEKLLAAWNAHQPEGVLALLTEDVRYEDASWPKTMYGHSDVRAFLESTWRAVPDFTLVLDGDVLLDPVGPRAARYWRVSGTQTGFWDPPGLQATGRRFTFHGAAFLEFRDEKACEYRVVYDVGEIMRQLGVLPARGRLGERLVISAANLRARVSSRLTG